MLNVLTESQLICVYLVYQRLASEITEFIFFFNRPQRPIRNALRSFVSR